MSSRFARAQVLAVSLLAVAVLLVACTVERAPLSSPCANGATDVCDCAGGTTGRRVCESTRWSSCMCSTAGSGGASGSGGVGGVLGGVGGVGGISGSGGDGGMAGASGTGGSGGLSGAGGLSGSGGEGGISGSGGTGGVSGSGGTGGSSGCPVGYTCSPLPIAPLPALGVCFMGFQQPPCDALGQCPNGGTCDRSTPTMPKCTITCTP